MKRIVHPEHHECFAWTFYLMISSQKVSVSQCRRCDRKHCCVISKLFDSEWNSHLWVFPLLVGLDSVDSLLFSQRRQKKRSYRRPTPHRKSILLQLLPIRLPRYPQRRQTCPPDALHALISSATIPIVYEFCSFSIIVPFCLLDSYLNSSLVVSNRTKQNQLTCVYLNVFFSSDVFDDILTSRTRRSNDTPSKWEFRSRSATVTWLLPAKQLLLFSVDIVFF